MEFRRLLFRSKLKALAITGDKRAAQLPNVPTAKEAGLPGLEVMSFTTLVASKDVPDALVEKINKDIQTIYANPNFRKGLENLGMTPVGNTPAQAKAYIEKEKARWDKVISRSEEHTSELQSLMRNSYAVFCLKKKK